jgi:hypothetical protein
MLRTTSAERTFWAIASAQAAPPAGQVGITSIGYGYLVTLGSEAPKAPASNLDRQTCSGTNLAERDRLPYDISEPNGAAIVNQTPHRGIAETSAAKPPLIPIPDQRSSRQCEPT